MPTIAFGLGQKNKTGPPKAASAGQKRKINFLDDGDDDVASISRAEDVSTIGGLHGLGEPGSQKPNAESNKTATQHGGEPRRFTNLSALHSAKQHTEKANDIDSSIYDYDAAYDSFHVAKEKSGKAQDATPKYMTNLLKSAEVRKRDQLRAKDKLLQRERDAEGDEFADKEKFVTGAYKAQQEEVRRMEEEEAIKDAEEEAKRKKGAGMTGFYENLLKKDEERSAEISKAEHDAATKPVTEEKAPEEEELSASKLASELNAKGAKVVMNDDGEVVDKRQLLSAGLNVAPKPKSNTQKAAQAGGDVKRPSDYSRSAAAHSARGAQRDRQTRMMADQLEKMAEQQAQAEAEEQKALEAKAKSQKTGSEISSAKERYLARKREQEAQRTKEKS